MSDDDLPAEVKTTLDELSNHYGGFEANNRGANGYLYFATNKITGAKIAIKFYAEPPRLSWRLGGLSHTDMADPVSWR